MIKKILAIVTIAIVFAACKSKETNGNFTVTGNLKNVADQEVYLEELFYDEREPQVIDTAKIIGGKFAVQGNAAEEGFFRLRMQNMEHGYLFINDAAKIDFTADAADSTITGATFNTPANQSFKKFLSDKQNQVKDFNTRLAALAASTAPEDSIIAARQNMMTSLLGEARKYITNTLDTTKSPALAMFVMGYAIDLDSTQRAKIVPSLKKRFAKHNGMQALLKRYESAVAEMEAKKNAPQTAPAAKIKIGAQAPDLTMPGVDGNPVSISQFKGKYLLVDFWASWCGPCRRENPNVVAAYNKFKDKNFTILGVSLDKDKTKWIDAIAADKLTWTHMSDLREWESEASMVYNIESIPYNVLLDPSGKIIAENLTGAALESKLTEVLK